MAEGGSHPNVFEEVNRGIIQCAAVVSIDGTSWDARRLLADDGAVKFTFPEESVSTWDGNDPAIPNEGGPQRFSTINSPQGEVFTDGIASQLLPFSATCEAMEGLPIFPFKRACSAIDVSKSSCLFDDKSRSWPRSWPGSPYSKLDKSFRFEFEEEARTTENVVDTPHEMADSWHNNSYENLDSIQECEEAAATLNVSQDLNKCVLNSTSTDISESDGSLVGCSSSLVSLRPFSGSLVGLRSCSVDSEPAFDSREDSDSDSTHSYKAEVDFPAGIDSVQAPVSAAYSDPSTSESPPRTVVHQEVSSFGGFQDISAYRHAHIIFARIEEIFGIDFTQKYRIGRGGRNVVYSDRNGVLALKKCQYQENVLNIIYKLKHRNVISLLGVALSNPRTSICWQIMRRMNTDLHKAWEPYRADGLVKRLSNSHEDSAPPPDSPPQLLNVVFIIMEVAKALVYLDSLGVVHGDVKGPNILLSNCMECRSQFDCTCRVKYVVVIADFDSVCYAGCDPSHSHTGGTVGFRAPEVCIRGQGIIEINHCSCCSKSDVYSLGVVALKMLGGREIKAQARRDANLLNRNPTLRDTLSERNELNYVSALKNLLCGPIMDTKIEGLKFLFRTVAHCSKPDVDQRPSPNELLEKLESFKI